MTVIALSIRRCATARHRAGRAGWDLASIAGADDAAEDNGEDRGDGDPGKQDTQQDGHEMDNGPRPRNVTAR